MDTIHFTTARSASVALGTELRPEAERLYIYRAMRLAQLYPHALSVAVFIEEAMHIVKNTYEKTGEMLGELDAIDVVVDKLGNLTKNVWIHEVYPALMADLGAETDANQTS
jgi:hypothetical protein